MVLIFQEVQQIIKIPALMDKILNKILNKKDKPIYLSHSDYYYCPNSKTEKNLNDQQSVPLLMC